MSERLARDDEQDAGVDRLPEHTTNPVDVKLSNKQVQAIGDGEVLLLEHALCGEAIRLWKEVADD